MPRLKNVDVEEREGWVLEQFRSNPQLSAPAMNKKMKERYKSTMRAKRLYELRDIIAEELGWAKDKLGVPQAPKPKKGRRKGQPQDVQPDLNVPALRAGSSPDALSEANRLGEEIVNDSLFSTWIVPADGIEDAVSFSRKLNHLRDKGGTNLKVDSFTDRYVVVSVN